MRSGRFVRRLVVSGAVLLLPAMGYAQEATVSGTVTDVTGGVLPGVVVQAVNDATGNSFETVTDGLGVYRLAVRVGVYRVTAQLQGFGTVIRSNVEVLVGQQAVVNVQLSPATIEESVTVSGSAPLIDVTSSRVAGNIDPRQMQELPLNGRNWMDLTMLAPGSRINTVGELPIASQASSIGVQMNVDGQQVTNLIALGFGQPRFSRDTIAEFEFVSNRFDASQGRSYGVQVNAITKSGTNDLSGSFSSYFRNDTFNAADPVTEKVLPYSDQQVSGTLGGPITRDRAHFFVGYEYEREPLSYAYTTPYARFNDVLTGRRLELKGMARVDYQFSSQTRLSVRGTRYDNRIPYDPRYTGGASRTPASAIGTNRRSNQLLASVVKVLGNRAVSETRVGYDMFHWNQYPHVRNANSGPGMTPGFGAPRIDLRGITLGQDHEISPQDLGEELFTFRNDVSVSFAKGGRHDVKFGGEYINYFTFETVCYRCMGRLDAQGGAVPANIQDLFPDMSDVSTWNLAALSPITRYWLQAIAMDASPFSRPSGGSGFTEYAPRHVYAGWLQDDWAITPRLTLNLGLRYDLEVGAFVNWVEYKPFLEAGRPDDTNNVGPRVGFAYELTDRTILRGGYGKYFATISGQPAIFTLRNVQQIQPQVLNDGRPDFAANPFNGPLPTYEQAKQLLCSNNPRPNCLRPSFSNLVAPDLEMPYSHQASLGVARELSDVMAIEADWVFTGERGRFQGQNINMAYNPATGANYPFSDISKRPYPDWGQLQMNRPIGKSNDHALQVAFTKRMSNRWQASGTYLLSGNWEFDNLPLNPGCQYPVTISAAGTFVCDVPITLAPDVSENRYVLTGAQRHRLTFNGIWDAGYGFQVSGLYIYGDEGTATPNSGVDVRQTGGGGGRLRSNGTLIERNSFDRPSIHRVDLRIQRGFNLGGGARIEGIFEMFNVFNHANYESFVLNERNARFGRPQQSAALAYAPRMLQLGFRTTF